MAVDVESIVLVTQAALQALVTSGGSVVNVASVAGLGGDSGMTIYNAAKGAVINLTRSLAVELAPQGVRVNAVAPSLTTTDATADISADDVIVFVRRIPLGQTGGARRRRRCHRVPDRDRRTLRDGRRATCGRWPARRQRAAGSQRTADPIIQHSVIRRSCRPGACGGPCGGPPTLRGTGSSHGRVGWEASMWTIRSILTMPT